MYERHYYQRLHFGTHPRECKKQWSHEENLNLNIFFSSCFLEKIELKLNRNANVLFRRCNPRAASVRGKWKQEDKAILPKGASEATERRNACSNGFAEYHCARG